MEASLKLMFTQIYKNCISSFALLIQVVRFNNFRTKLWRFEPGYPDLNNTFRIGTKGIFVLKFGTIRNFLNVKSRSKTFTDWNKTFGILWIRKIVIYKQNPYWSGSRATYIRITTGYPIVCWVSRLNRKQGVLDVNDTLVVILLQGHLL